MFELCEKWEVGGAAIGTVTETGRMRVLSGDELLGDMPVRALVDDCPLYDLEPAKPAEPIYPAPRATLGPDRRRARRCWHCSASANLASRRPLFERYDPIVQSRTVRRPEQADAAVLALADGSALAVCIDGNGRRVAADPRTGTIATVLECAANLACVGAEPLGTTNNLNFGNPEKPHIAWQLTEAVRGPGRGLPGAAGADRRRQRLALQRGRRRPDLPDAGDRHGRAPARRHARRAEWVSPAPATRSRCSAPSPPRSAACELAKLRGEPLPDGLPGDRAAGRDRGARGRREAVRSGAAL